MVVAENLAEPSGRPLTRSRIVDACLRLVEREGVAGLSMRKLADALGKTPMAVYRHVADKRELLSLVVAEVSGQFVVPAAEGSPRDQIIGAVESVHHVLDRHRWMVTAMLDGELLAPSSLRLSEFLLAAMRRAGLSVEQAALLHVAIWQYVFGHLLIGHGVASRMLPSSFERFAESGGDPDEYPMIRDTALTLANLDHAARFGVGLRALVDGMLARSAPD